MSKLSTALSLVFSGDFANFRRQVWHTLRRWRLRQAQGRPFIYRLAGVPFTCVPGLPDSETHYLTRDFDRLEMDLLRSWLEPGDAFVDVGANVGVYALSASHFTRDTGVVLAIEASTELVKLLRSSAGVLGSRNFTVVECAAGDVAKEVVFYTASAGHGTGEQSLRPDPLRLADYVPRRMQMRTIAEIVIAHPAAARPAVVKLDIEGAEPLALRAVPPDWLEAGGPLWIVEINPEALARNDFSSAALAGFFPAAHFDRWLSPHYAYSGARTLPPRLLAVDECFKDARFYNLIALPRGTNTARKRGRTLPLLEQMRTATAKGST